MLVDKFNQVGGQGGDGISGGWLVVEVDAVVDAAVAFAADMAAQDDFILVAGEADAEGMVTYYTKVRKGALFLDLEAGRL